MTDAVDPFAGKTLIDPPTETPVAGEVYQRYPGGPIYPVIECDWKHPVHGEWAAERKRRDLAPPFYVSSPKGTVIGWVPWPGSVVVWPYDYAWVMDLFQKRKGETPNFDALPTSPTWRGSDARPLKKK